MLVLVVNAGSSTLKAQLIQTDDGSCLMKSLAEKIGFPDASMKVAFPSDPEKRVFDMADMSIAECLEKLVEVITEDEASPINDVDEIEAIGNRIVSGGEFFIHSEIVDEDVLEKVKICSALAPLHNPHAADCIERMMKDYPEIPQVCVFDNAFHMTMPAKAYMYPLPMRYYDEYHIRRYGAHGTSHRYAAQRAAEMMGKELSETNAITCHLGSGGSVACVQSGECVDTSMGMTPLEGIMMGTRCGSIDPTIVTSIMRREGLSCDEMDDLMNKQSGILGITGFTSDMREILEGAETGDERAQLALDMFVYRVQKSIGEYFAVLPRTDAVVMTAGIGENSADVRELVFAGLAHLGMELDDERNRAKTDEADYVISMDGSPVKIFVVAADEEMCIARETLKLVG